MSPFPRRLGRGWILLLVFLESAGPIARAEIAGASTPPVRLPQITVRGAPVPPEREAWRYLALPGYEILSQATDARTAGVAAFLLRFARITERTFPAIRRTRAQEAWLILCTSRPEFESFIPASVRAELDLAVVDRLFLAGPRHETVVLYLGNLAGGGDFDVDLATNSLRWRLASARPPLPPWYIEGIARIFAAGDVTDWPSHETVAIGKLDERRANNVSQTSDGSISIGSANLVDSAPAVTTDVAQIVRGDLFAAAAEDPGAPPDPAAANPDYYGLSCKRYFSETHRPVPSLEELFSGPSKTGYADWSQGCCLFVHYCLFGQRGKYSRALETFFNRLTPGADPAATFHAAFGKSYSEMDRLLSSYLGSSSYRVMEFKLPAPGGAGAAALAPREATDGEIADLKAGAYANAGFPERAGGELLAAYQREKAAGPLEPRLRAALETAGIKPAEPRRGP